MLSSSTKTYFHDALALADIRVNGDRPWDLQIKDERAYERIIRFQNLGLGESYMDGWVDCQAWDECIYRILHTPEFEQHLKLNWRLAIYALEGILINLGSKSRAFKIGEAHYDVGNDLYSYMLDKRLVYTCGYWKNATTLDQAQEDKLELTCRKLGLKPGMRILDIGCGWGSFVKYAAEKYGVTCVGITVSREQAELARKSCEGLPIEIRLQDYRDVNEPFDAVVSLGMFEHVGYKNYRTYMEVVDRCLAPGGLFLLHTIGGNQSTRGFDPWIGKYIFPNSMLPSIAQIAKSIEGLFVMEDWHNFGPDYDKTLMVWHANFEKHWPEIASQYSERFYRMWRYYLLICAGSFRARKNELWQIVLSKGGLPTRYDRPSL